MSYRGLISLVFTISIFFIACTKEPESVSLEGDYSLTLFEKNNCIDSTENRFFSIDSGFCLLDTFVGFERCQTSGTISFTSTSYNLDRTLDENGTITEVSEMGSYSRVDNNNYVFCNPECDTVFVVLNDNIINVVKSDTLTRCGTLIRAVRN